MELLINELSFESQSTDAAMGSQLMRNLLDVVLAFKKHRPSERVFCSSTFYSSSMAPGYTVLDHAKSLTKSLEKKTFFEIITKGPYIDVLLTEKIPNHVCTFNNHDVRGGSLAGAAYLSGVLASLANSVSFASASIRVDFSEEGNTPSSHNLENFLDVESLTQRLRFRYMPTSKHQRGGSGTLMDLSDEVAEDILNIGIQRSNGRQIYSCHQGRLYEFQYDNAGAFHGYPVAGCEVPNAVLFEMYERSMITRTEYRRFLTEGPISDR